VAAANAQTTAVCLANFIAPSPDAYYWGNASIDEYLPQAIAGLGACNMGVVLLKQHFALQQWGAS
jgi:hypothetical protein